MLSRRLFLFSEVIVIYTLLLFLSGDRREEVLPVDIEGWRRFSNASFKENFRMDRIVFEVTGRFDL